MKYRLSTLLIVITALAILLAQYGSVNRFATVAAIELLLLFIWDVSRGGRFPWRTILVAAIAADLWAAGTAYAYESGRDFGSRVQTAFTVAFLGAILLAILVGLVHACFKMLEAVLRLNRPKLGPPTTLCRTILSIDEPRE